MLPQKIAFLDVETTGVSSFRDRIIEIGILRVEDGKLVSKYQSLINPNMYISPEIVSLTGIVPSQLEKAPPFEDVARTILKTIEDCILVAHNVRFDLGFLKNEFRRQEISFFPKHFCSVKLSQRLFPTFKRHNLDEIISRFDIECVNRHRAFDDAAVLFEFYKKVLTLFPEEKIEEAIKRVMKRPSLPLKLPEKELDNLPETAGVYIFYGENGMPLYVGKSINLRDRVLSHFSNDFRLSIDMKLAQSTCSLETIQTAGELGALLLEADLIKKLQPLYNRVLRNKRKLTVVKEKELPSGHMSVTVGTCDEIDTGELDTMIGVFRSKRQATNFLLEQAKKYQLCEKLLGIDHSSPKACFSYRLGNCRGACAQKETMLSYNIRFIEAFTNYKFKKWPFATPIVLSETNPHTDKTDAFVLDRWVLLGKLDDSNDLTPPEDVPFDVDTYKILYRFLQSSKKSFSIHPLSPSSFLNSSPINS